jgi:hypothetical protein
MRAIYLDCTSPISLGSPQANPQTAAHITSHCFTLYPEDYNVIAKVLLNKK